MDNNIVIKQPNFQIVNFNAAYVAPKYVFSKGKSMITWGKNNNFPAYLHDLFNSKGASLHTSIINKKVSYIAGKGFDKIGDINLQDFIERNDLTAEIKKASYDFEILNGFALEVIWSMDKTKISSVKHFPISQLRFGLIDDEHHLPYFWYCKDWTNERKYGMEAINAYNEDFPGGKQIYWYCEYNPENTLVDYPIPFYSNSINAIETSHQIAQFHLNQAKQGYAPSFLINFATGIPSPEERDLWYEAFQQQYAGTENGGKAIVTYSENELQKPTFVKIDLNDSDERFLMLKDWIAEEIVIGHDIPPQLLILTAGKLSGTSEGPEKVNEFKEGYIQTRQIVFENILNKILKPNGYTDKIVLKKEIIKIETTTTNGN